MLHCENNLLILTRENSDNSLNLDTFVGHTVQTLILLLYNQQKYVSSKIKFRV